MIETNNSVKPPHSIQSEKSVLGGLTLENNRWEDVSSRLTESDFYIKDHAIIFNAIRKLAEKKSPFDLVTLSEALESSGELISIGSFLGEYIGFGYIAMLCRDTPSAANVMAYAGIVKERSILRQLMAIGSDLYNSAANSQGKDAEELISEYALKLQSIGCLNPTGNVRHIKDILSEAVDEIEIAFENDGGVTGIPTGFIDLDEVTSGLQRADLITIAGRPSMGKTSLAMNIAENVALKTSQPVLIFSLEMKGKSLAKRSMSSIGRVDAKKIKTGNLDDDEWPRLTSAINLLASSKMFIDDSSSLTVDEIRQRARQLASEQGQLGLIVIDYLGKIKSNNNKPTHEQIGDNTGGLKDLAKELNCPVIILSQLNRELEKRPNKRPIMSDLRASGAIEQDSDLIIFVYRDEVYNENSPDKGVAELIIGKQRDGEIKTIRCSFLGQFTRFENHAGQQYSGDDYE